MQPNFVFGYVQVAKNTLCWAVSGLCEDLGLVGHLVLMVRPHFESAMFDWQSLDCEAILYCILDYSALCWGRVFHVWCLFGKNNEIPRRLSTSLYSTNNPLDWCRLLFLQTAQPSAQTDCDIPGVTTRVIFENRIAENTKHGRMGTSRKKPVTKLPRHQLHMPFHGSPPLPPWCFPSGRHGASLSGSLSLECKAPVVEPWATALSRTVGLVRHSSSSQAYCSYQTTLHHPGWLAILTKSVA